MSRKKVPLSAAYRWSVASRVLAAVIGAYAFTSAASVLLALLLPMPRAQATLLSSMVIGYLIYAVAVIWIFSIRSVARAWVVMLAGTALMAVWSWLLLLGEQS